MSQQKNIEAVASKRWISPSLFFAAMLCFFMPFCDIKCGTISLATVSGIDMAVGKDLTSELANKMGNKDSDSTEDKKKSDKSGFNPFALLALIATGVGMGVVLLGDEKRRATKAATITAIIGAVSLVLTAVLMRPYISWQLKADKEAAQVMSIIKFGWQAGYWLCLLFLVLALAFNLLRQHFLEEERKRFEYQTNKAVLEDDTPPSDFPSSHQPTLFDDI